MGRLILSLLAIAALIAIFFTATQVVQSGVRTAKEADVPKTAKTISYVLLIMLMFGVVTGWLGGL